MPKDDEPRGKSWDLRWTPPDQSNYETWSHEPIIEWVKERCKKWAFQLEKGEATGKYHWQCRLSFHTNKKRSTVFTDWNRLFNDDGTSYHLSPTSKTNIGNEFYVIKKDTRVRGPWSDKTDTRYVQERFRNPVPRDWQLKLDRKIQQLLNDNDDRHVVFVVDEGNTGKSWFKGWQMTIRDNVVMMPSSLDQSQMQEFICSSKRIKEGWKGIIMMDCPRATSPKHWFTLANGLEQVKQGFLSDHRYGATEKRIAPPQIIVFANKKPPEGCLSKDVFRYFDKETGELNIE